MRMVTPMARSPHCPNADYDGVRANLVEREDGVCHYGDRKHDIWPRVLDAETGDKGEGDDPASNFEAFVQHADNARGVIQFIH